MSDGHSSRRPVVVVVVALAAAAIGVLGVQAVAGRWVEVVEDGSVASVLDTGAVHAAALVTTQSAYQELEAGLADGDRLPAPGPPLLVARVLQQGASSWCTSATADVTTAADGTIVVAVSRPWWRRLPLLDCTEDVPAPSGIVVALDEQELAAAPAVQVTGDLVTPATPFDLLRCTPGDGPDGRGWVCRDELT